MLSSFHITQNLSKPYRRRNLDEKPFSHEVRIDFAYFDHLCFGRRAAQRLSNAEQAYVKRGIRVELVFAAYGDAVPLRVFNENDNQLEKALEMLPQARQMAINSFEKIK